MDIDKIELEERKMDVREIRLSKDFRRENNSNNSSWYVFGHYDGLEVKKIELNNSIHPLERLLQESHNLTFRNNGNTKYHVLYILSNETRDRIECFWSGVEHRPLLSVSLIHFAHPLKKPIKEVISDIRKAIDSQIDSNIIDYVLYTSLDCNDLAIIWSSKSFKTTMNLVSSTWEKCYLIISEVFTIQACRFDILSGLNNDLYKEWCLNEPILECVRVHIRESNYRKALSLAGAMDKAILSRKNSSQLGISTQTNHYVIPGQEDIVIVFEKIPIEWFIDMYRQRTSGDIEDELVGILHNNVASRSVIDTVISVGSVDTRLSTGTSDNIPTSISEGYLKFKSIVQKHNLPRTQWLAALYELLIELSYNEVSSTSYDIYVQSKDCQLILIEYLEKIIEFHLDEKYKEIYENLMDSQSDLVYCLQRYLQGWSQLSFHAMHAEWQLTQVSDVNRLYLFPSKLNRLYASFMKLSSHSLNCNCDSRNKYEIGYFLTPSMRTDAEFLSVFGRYNQQSILILGEIPADLLFVPQVLLPILVHEAAHYAGHDLRNREIRYECLVRSMLYHVVNEYIADELLYTFDGEYFVLERCIDRLYERVLSQKNSHSDTDCYGEEVRKSILYDILNMLRNEPGFGYIAFHEILDTNEYIKLDRIQRRLFAQKYDGKLDEKLSLESVENYNNIEMHFEQLITIYRESFSDLCMIKLLDLSIAEYLNVIYRSNRFEGRTENSNWEYVLQWIRFERYICVICSIVGEENFQQELAKIINDKDELAKHVAINRKDHNGIRELVGDLLKIYLDENEDIFSSPYERAWLLHYLEVVSKDIEKDMMKNEHIDDLRDVYQSLSIKVRSANGEELMDILEPCMMIMRGDTNHWH